MQSLSASRLENWAHDWEAWAHGAQLPPPGDWRAWVFMGGRGAGKTRAGAEWVSAGVREGRFSRVALIAPTFQDVRDGNVVRVRFYSGVLSSAAPDDVLNGANVFAVEGADGEWEIIQARHCTLVVPGEYELRGFLRGVLGSAHAMGAPHAVGARVVKLDQRLARVEIGAHEWGEPLTFRAPPTAAAADDPRAAIRELALPQAATRPWAPAHVRAKREESGDVHVRWVRCARLGGDAWGAGEPPLGAPSESYQVEVLDGADLLRTVTVSTAEWTYPAADQMADFEAPPASLRLRLAQMDAYGRAGLKTELTMSL